MALKEVKRRDGPRNRLDKDGLTPKERLFVEYYVGEANFNGSKAAGLAGYSPARTRVTGTDLLKRPRVIKCVADALDERSKAMRVSQTMVLGEAFTSYMEAKAQGKFSAAARFLEMAGRHVDVNAFRTILGIGGVNGGPVELHHEVDLTVLSDEELEQYGRIAEKLAPGSGGQAEGDAS